jgi:hypothetical protein
MDGLAASEWTKEFGFITTHLGLSVLTARKQEDTVQTPGHNAVILRAFRSVNSQY